MLIQKRPHHTQEYLAKLLRYTLHRWYTAESCHRPFACGKWFAACDRTARLSRMIES
jgi:hypothetical protein